jgi:hypothetical protein
VEWTAAIDDSERHEDMCPYIRGVCLPMSVHSCSPYCDLDDRFHEVLKYQLDARSCYLSNDDLKTKLLKKRQELDELIGVLVANPDVGVMD